MKSFAIRILPSLVLGLVGCGFTGHGLGDDVGGDDGPPDGLANDGPDTLSDAHTGIGEPVHLRSAGTYGVLAAASISATSATLIGDLGVYPAAASYVTGLSLILDGSTEFSTSAQVTGRIYAHDYGGPTPAKLLAAIDDMKLAYAEAAARVATVTDLGGGVLDGMTIPPGVYHWSGGVDLATTVTLAGHANDVWIFTIDGTLDLAASATVILAGGASPANVFWQLPGAVTLGAMAHIEGVVLTATAFTSGAGTTIRGRVLSQTDVTITGSTLSTD